MICLLYLLASLNFFDKKGSCGEMNKFAEDEKMRGEQT